MRDWPIQIKWGWALLAILLVMLWSQWIVNKNAIADKDRQIMEKDLYISWVESAFEVQQINTCREYTIDLLEAKVREEYLRSLRDECIGTLKNTPRDLIDPQKYYDSEWDELSNTAIVTPIEEKVEKQENITIMSNPIVIPE